MRHRTFKLAVAAVIVSFGFAYPLLTSTATTSSAGPDTKPLPQSRRSAKARTVGQTPRADYSRFSHRVAQHRQACDSCHKFPTRNWKEARKADAAFPDVTDYPEHSSCVSCHRRQFFRGAQPVICSACHASVSPSGGPRHPFPNPAEAFDSAPKGQTAVSEFGVAFPHDKHVDLVGQLQPVPEINVGVASDPVVFAPVTTPQESEPKSCSVCHQTYQPQGDSDQEFVTKPPKNLSDDSFWLKKGTFKTSPASHSTCFTCHSEDSGLKPASSDCNTCHKLLQPEQAVGLAETRGDFDPKLAQAMGIKDKTTLEKWARRNSGKFRHEWMPHANISCTICHNVAAINTLDDKTKKVPVRSCGGEGTGCHIEATTEGVLNFEVDKKKSGASFQCTKCHINNGRNPVPDTHANAISTAKTK